LRHQLRIGDHCRDKSLRSCRSIGRSFSEVNSTSWAPCRTLRSASTQ
jgi:hypothetical protein